MDSKLTHDTTKAIMNCATRFDGYAYFETVKKPGIEAPAYLIEAQRYFNSTSELFGSSSKNMLVNFFLHRQFHHWGWLPDAYSDEWYYMVYLYLHTYRLPTPEKYRINSMAKEWEHCPQGSAEAAAADIRKMLMQRR
ncbi:hypothetical protein ACFSRY_10045 [Pontibacter locisalis]|uniref:Uncharacterized protein n=1 Tax=Pontibacter locisalis TaxID=1719035 RepID=A0ABW5ILJ9_9BACT